MTAALQYPLTLQDAFSHVYRTFVIDRRPFNGRPRGDKIPGFKCVYAPLSSAHAGCAIGCCLPTEKAEEVDAAGGGPVDSLDEAIDDFSLREFFSADPDDLWMLQTLHDGDPDLDALGANEEERRELDQMMENNRHRTNPDNYVEYMRLVLGVYAREHGLEIPNG